MDVTLQRVAKHARRHHKIDLSNVTLDSWAAALDQGGAPELAEQVRSAVARGATLAEPAKKKKSAHQRAAERQTEREKCAARIAELEIAVSGRRTLTKAAEERIEADKRAKKKAKARAERTVLQERIDADKLAIADMTKRSAKDQREIAQCANKIARLAA